jgi:hypothetical protein
MIDDPTGWGVFVMDCDAFGGLEAGRRAHAMLGQVVERIPAILISSDCVQQLFPEGRVAPVELRGPASAVAIRVGMEHALRGRLAWQTA